jgi:hypothetical protein
MTHVNKKSSLSNQYKCLSPVDKCPKTVDKHIPLVEKNRFLGKAIRNNRFFFTNICSFTWINTGEAVDKWEKTVEESDNNGEKTVGIVEKPGRCQ